MGEENKVEALFGGVVPGTFTTHPGLIEELKELLEAAEAGEIVGLAGAVMYRDETAAPRIIGLSNRSLLGTLVCVQHDLVDILNDA